MTDVLEINSITGKTIERDYTEAEAEQRTKDLAKHKQLAKDKAERIKAKQAVLDRLGITADEAALLLGQRHACTNPDCLRNNTNQRTIKSTQHRTNTLQHYYSMRKGI